MIHWLKALLFCRNGHAPYPMGIVGGPVGSDVCVRCGGLAYK